MTCQIEGLNKSNYIFVQEIQEDVRKRWLTSGERTLLWVRAAAPCRT